MVGHPVATTYARALLEVGQDKSEADAYAGELASLRDEILGARDFRVFFESPKIPREKKDAVLVKALQGKVSGPVLNLVRVLIRRGRQFLLSDIANAYEKLNDELQGRVHAHITSASALSPAAKDRVVALLKQKLDKEIIAAEKVDSDLLGGMTIRVGDTVVDGSVRSRLNEIRDRVAAPRLGSELIA